MLPQTASEMLSYGKSLSITWMSRSSIWKLFLGSPSYSVVFRHMYRTKRSVQSEGSGLLESIHSITARILDALLHSRGNLLAHQAMKQ